MESATCFFCCVASHKSTSYKPLHLSVTSVHLDADSYSFHAWSEILVLIKGIISSQLLTRPFGKILYCIISHIILAFWLVLTYDQLEHRRIDDVLNLSFGSLFQNTDRLHVAVRVFRNRSQTSKCVRTSVPLGYGLMCHFCCPHHIFMSFVICYDYKWRLFCSPTARLEMPKRSTKSAIRQPFEKHENCAVRIASKGPTFISKGLWKQPLFTWWVRKDKLSQYPP